jgi:Deacetylases, including yeast histone deacetylase and acetoin utilization protein
MKFATYLHPETTLTSRPVNEIEFRGHSHPYFSQVRTELEKHLSKYPKLTLRQAEYSDYLKVHSETYIQKLIAMASGEKVEQPPRLSIECKGLEFCLPGYLFRLGGMLEAIDEMKSGNLDRAYCCSGGGHHAYKDWGHGYCILNSLAAAARYAQEHGFAKVLIVDWDIHHGDGTQSIFAHDPSVHCISIHSAADLYMALAAGLRYGTTETGESLGHQNIPVVSKAYDDNFIIQANWGGKFYRAEESLKIFRESLDKVPWKPDLILILSGYDAHIDDQGRNIMNWTNEDFVSLTKFVLDFAHKVSCPVLSTHGGGYNLPVTISAACSHVETLATY